MPQGEGEGHAHITGSGEGGGLGGCETGKVGEEWRSGGASEAREESDPRSRE